jgi:ribonuclease HII
MPGSIQIAQLRLAQIRDLIRSGEGLDHEMQDQLQGDSRRGALKLWRSLQKTRDQHLRAKARLQDLIAPEKNLRQQGFRTIAGLDEAGRGPLAGPVVSAAVVPPWPCHWFGVDDSKRLTPGAREAHAQRILTEALAVGLGIVSAERIDTVGILQATWESMRRALASMSLKPDHLLVDGPLPIPEVSVSQTPLVDGDARSLSVAAASVVAKVTRDEIMQHLDTQHPQYGFARHKGYGTPEHLAALRRYGPCFIHRRSFRRVVVRTG